MFWIIALVILALAAAEGYFTGAVRAAFAFFALVVAAFLAVPLAPLAKPLLGLFGIKYFITVAFLSPVVAWIVIVLAVRALGESVNYKVNYFYKYKVGDELRLFWERLSRRLGACVGVLNGAVYFFTFSVLVYSFGYPIVQIASSEKDPFLMRVANQLALGLQSARMDKAVSPFAPGSEEFYDASDVMGTVYQNPPIQVRLGRYPAFLALMERDEFKTLSRDKEFQAAWKSHPPFHELVANPKLQPLVTNQENYKLVMDALGGDLDDLATYLQTGTSPKYSDLLILGKWRISISRSYRLARRENLSASAAERMMLRHTLETGLSNATLTAYPDSQLQLRVTTTNNTPQVTRGSWKQANRHTYTLRWGEGGKSTKSEADVEEHRLTFNKDGLPLVFLK